MCSKVSRKLKRFISVSRPHVRSLLETVGEFQRKIRCIMYYNHKVITITEKQHVTHTTRHLCCVC
jgi:hypothetical protein